MLTTDYLNYDLKEESEPELKFITQHESRL